MYVSKVLVCGVVVPMCRPEDDDDDDDCMTEIITMVDLTGTHRTIRGRVKLLINYCNRVECCCCSSSRLAVP